MPLALLDDRLAAQKDQAFSYVVPSVRWNPEVERFEQHGCGPNLEGGVLTLCTCKHKMRASLPVEQWGAGVWIAGFTSRTIYDGTHWLFFLARIGVAYESHAELWASLDANVRKAKAAHLRYLGDVYKPKRPGLNGAARFRPSQYIMPALHAHRKHRTDNGWKNDIRYRHRDRYWDPALLVADPKHTYFWSEPTICFTGYGRKHCRDYFKWKSLQDLRKCLESV